MDRVLSSYTSREGRRSEDELMGELALGQPPARLEVFRQALLLLDSLDDGLVGLLLLRRLGFGEGGLGLWLALLEELALGRRFGGLGLLSEERIGDLVSDL